MKGIAFWDWRTEPLPDARVVVAVRGLLAHTGRTIVRPQSEALIACGDAARKGVLFVADGQSEALGSSLIPALYAERQADLEGLVCDECGEKRKRPEVQDWKSQPRPCQVCQEYGRIGGIRDLLAVKAERRALVVTPREALSLLPALRRQEKKHVDCSHDDLCPMCTGEFCALDGAGGCGWGPHSEGYPCEHSVDERHLEPTSVPTVDLVIVAPPHGPDAWPLHPAWIRTIRDQCAAAGVPFVFMGWGEWAPTACVQERTTHCALMFADGTFLLGGVPLVQHHSRAIADGSCQVFHRVGPGRSGRLLDGVTHDSLPAWAKEGG